MHRSRKTVLILAASVALLGAGCVVPTGGGRGTTYYLSPTGSDAASGAANAPWQHFAKAFAAMHPGDTLLLGDGTYHESLKPPSNLSGTQADPIFVWAAHDGSARIDGDSARDPIDLEGNDYFDIRGVVAFNGSGGVVAVNGSSANPSVGNTFRRVSAYNSAAPASDPNHHVWEFWHAPNTTIEDCAAAGRGRTIMTVMESDALTVRRCWFRADANTAWQNGSPQPVVQVYNESNAIFENNVVVGGAIPTVVGVVDWDNVYGGPDSEVNTGNRYLGNVVTSNSEYGMSIGATQCKLSRDHLWQNNVVVGSQMGYALRGGKGLTLDHDTAVGGTGGSYGVWMNASPDGVGDDQCSPNGGNNSGAWGYYSDTAGSAPYQHSDFAFSATLSNSAVQGYPYGALGEVHSATTPALTSHDNDVRGTSAAFGGLAHAGTNDVSSSLTWNTATYGTGAYLLGPTNNSVGARVIDRYVNGTLTNQPLWPWPMEDRIWNETGDASLWQGANSLFPAAHQQSVMYDGINGRTGGLWRMLPG